MQWAFVRCYYGLIITMAAMLYENRQMWGSRKTKFWVTVRGVLTGMASLMYMATLALLPLGTGISIVSTYPAWTVILGHLIFGEPFGVLSCLSVCGVVAGATLVGRPHFLFGGGADQGSGLGYAVAATASLLSGLYIVAARKCSEEGHYNMEQLLLFNLFGSLFAFVGSFAVPGQQFVTLEAPEWGAVAVIVTTSLMLHWSYSYASNYIGAGFVGVLGSSELIYGFLWQVLYFRQESHWVSYVGAALIFCSICTISFINSAQNNLAVPPQGKGFSPTGSTPNTSESEEGEAKETASAGARPLEQAGSEMVILRIAGDNAAENPAVDQEGGMVHL